MTYTDFVLVASFLAGVAFGFRWGQEAERKEKLSRGEKPE